MSMVFPRRMSRAGLCLIAAVLAAMPPCLTWNSSDIEQRTGHIDRLACKAEGRYAIVSHLPYLGRAACERHFRVMRDRE